MFFNKCSKALEEVIFFPDINNYFSQLKKIIGFSEYLTSASEKARD